MWLLLRTCVWLLLRTCVSTALSLVPFYEAMSRSIKDTPSTRLLRWVCVENTAGCTLSSRDGTFTSPQIPATCKRNYFIISSDIQCTLHVIVMFHVGRRLSCSHFIIYTLGETPIRESRLIPPGRKPSAVSVQLGANTD